MNLAATRSSSDAAHRQNRTADARGGGDAGPQTGGGQSAIGAIGSAYTDIPILHGIHNADGEPNERIADSKWRFIESHIQHRSRNCIKFTYT